MTIFVAIAAYRDADLAHTIADCIAKARWPGELRFGLCRQFAPGDPEPGDVAPARMRRIDLPWQASDGACWARAQALSLYDGEEYLFQIDSHHRFAPDWDALLMGQAEASGEALPLLTTYAQAFVPGTAPAAGRPTIMRLHGFTAEGIPRFAQGPRPVAPDRAPWRARFLSAHLIFAPGRLVADMPYDPGLYFIGEEISLAVRAFTHGYALLHPSVPVMWHDYSRGQRVMHWHDLRAAERDAASLAKVARMLAGEDVGPFGLGTARGLREYEAYAGIDFARRHASAAARRGSEPAMPQRAGIAAGGSRRWRVRIPLARSALPDAAFDRPAFWYVALHDQAGVEIARADADGAEIGRMHAVADATTGALVIERRFVSCRRPARWTVQPVDRRRRWLPRLSGPLADADLSPEAG